MHIACVCYLQTNIKGRKWIYIAPFCEHLAFNALRYGSHSFTCKLYHTCLYLVSVRQTAQPLIVATDI